MITTNTLLLSIVLLILKLIVDRRFTFSIVQLAIGQVVDRQSATL